MIRTVYPVAMCKTDWLTLKRLVLRVGPRRAGELLGASLEMIDTLFTNGFVDQVALGKILRALKVHRDAPAEEWEPVPDVDDGQLGLFGGEA
jgi:hypothetical protein